MSKAEREKSVNKKENAVTKSSTPGEEGDEDEGDDQEDEIGSEALNDEDDDDEASTKSNEARSLCLMLSLICI